MRGVYANEADLRYTDFFKANLSEVKFINCDLRGSRLIKATLTDATLFWTDLSLSHFCGADLRNANLGMTVVAETDFERANLSGSKVFGVSAWKVKLNETIQTDLVITQGNEADITVDNLEVAQFVYLLLHNPKIREVIDTITSKAVLILGRFTSERKAVLDALREELRNRNYIPILFDFEKPDNRDLTETVMTLASLARFVIADLSDPNSIPHEVMSFARQLLSVPVQGIFCSVPAHQNEYPMYRDLQRLPHVLPIYRYENQEQLLAVLYEKVIQPAEDKVKELRPHNPPTP